MNSHSDNNDGVPLALEPFDDFSDDKYIVFQGEFKVFYKDKMIPARGIIFYAFHGNNQLLIEGETPSRIELEISKELIRLSGINIKGRLLLSSLTLHNDDSCSFRGIVIKLRKGPETMHKTWKWAYANMDYFHGLPVRSGANVSMDRLLFVAGNYRIIFENRPFLNSFKNDNQDKRFLSHYCRLEQINGDPIDSSTAIKTINCFSLFISFVVGRRHGPYFINGFDSDATNVTEYHMIYEEEVTTSVYSWKPVPYDQEITTLWTSFYDAYNAEDDRSDVLGTAVHWYLESNENHGMLEGAFIMAFTGLELLYNNLIGDPVSGNEEIVKRLIGILHLGNTISAASIANMRNQLVHYDTNNIGKYRLLTRSEKLNRMAMLLQLLELSILYRLDYKGHFSNRLLIGSSGPSEVEIVPWSL